MFHQDAYAGTKKSLRKKTDDGDLSSQFRAPFQLAALKPESIWDLTAVHGFLEAICRYVFISLFSLVISLQILHVWPLIIFNIFSQTQGPNLLWNEINFCIYVLNVSSSKVEGMRLAPDYKQIKYSKSNFKYLCDISALMLKYFVKKLPTMLDDSSISLAQASIDCFYECLGTAKALYQRKFSTFLKVLRKMIIFPAQ